MTEPRGPQPGEKFFIVGNYLVHDVGSCTCGPGGENVHHENYCGVEMVAAPWTSCC